MASTSQSESSSVLTKLDSLSAGLCHGLLGLVIVWSLLQPLDSTSVFDGSAQPQNLCWLMLALLVSIVQLVQRRSSPLSKLEFGSLIAVGLWLFAVTHFAADRFNPRTGWNGAWHLLSALALYYAIRSIVCSAVERSTVLGLLLVGGVLLAGLGAYQLAVSFPEMRKQYRADPDRVISLMQIDAPEGSVARKRLEDRLESPEPYASFALANSLAVYLSGTLVFALGLLGHRLIQQFTIAKRTDPQSRESALPRGQQSSRAFWGNLILLIAIVFLVGSVWLLTRSRIALIAVPISCAATIIGALWQAGPGAVERLGSKSKRVMRLGATLGVANFLLSIVWLWWRDRLVFSEAIKSLTFRLEYWQATLAIIRENPIWGIGLGNFQSIYPRFMLPTASETIADPHNWVLDLACTCSVPVAMVICFGIVNSLVRRPFSLLNDSSKCQTIHWPIALGAGLGGILVSLALVLFGDDPISLLCLSIAAVTFYVLSGSVLKYLTTSSLGATGYLLAMLICLLVSGSWQASGLMVPMLLSLALSRPTSQEAASNANQSLWLIRIATVLVSLLVVAFVWQSWLPTMQSQAAFSQTSFSIRQQIESIDRARKADPLNSEWDRLRAKLLTDLAIQEADRSTFEHSADQALVAIDGWAGREPQSFLTWQFAGERALELAGMSDRLGLSTQRFLEKALDYFDASARMRPASAHVKLQLAACLAIVGRSDDSKLAALEAEKLSATTPHADQKISAHRIFVPIVSEALQSDSNRGPYYSAEQVLEWIRRL